MKGDIARMKERHNPNEKKLKMYVDSKKKFKRRKIET